MLADEADTLDNAKGECYNEIKHPRDKIGRFTDGSSLAKEYVPNPKIQELSKKSIEELKELARMPKCKITFENITKLEWHKWYNAIGEIRRGIWYPKINGSHMIQIGRKIFITDAKYENPSLNFVIEFCDEDEASYYIERYLKK